MAIELDHFRRIGKRELGIEIARNALRIEPAPACIVRIVEHGEADLDLGVGKPLRGIRRARIEARDVGQLVVRGAETVIVGLPDLVHHGFAARGQAILVDPEQLLAGDGVIFDKRALLVGLVLARFLEFRRQAVLDRDADGLGAGDERARCFRLDSESRHTQRPGKRQD